MVGYAENNGHDDDDNILRPLPPEPTPWPPGTPEKVEVMRRRWAAGYHPHHPLDARYDGDTRTELESLQLGRLRVRLGRAAGPQAAKLRRQRVRALQP